MPKLLSSTALALVLAVPVWAQATPGLVAVQDSYAADDPPLETHSGTVLAQTTGAQEAEEEEVPSITESQPGVTTGEEWEEEDGGGIGAAGSTGEDGRLDASGDTAEGGRNGAGSGTGSGGTGGESGDDASGEIGGSGN